MLNEENNPKLIDRRPFGNIKKGKAIPVTGRGGL
jgi:hypothetical protein